MSDWLVMNAGMPQGSYLGPLTFIMLTDSLRVSCMTHKFIDDTNLSEIVTNSAASHMQDCCNGLAQQSHGHQWSQVQRDGNWLDCERPTAASHAQ